MMNRKVVLIGSMGAGKTSLGKRLAKRLGWAFVDTDYEICMRTGVDIPTIFEREGEAGFRLRERAMLEEVLARSGDAVVACGGGIVISAENRRMISRQFLVVFLDVSVGRQLLRISGDKNRPLVNVQDQKARLMQLRDERLGLYEGLADIRISTDANNFTQTLKKLCLAVKAQSGGFNVC